MPPVGPQGRRKAEKRSVDLSIVPPAEAPVWSPPPPEECYEPPASSFFLDDAHENRAIVRLTHHSITETLTEFAVIHQTLYRGDWRPVAMADSCHDVDVHTHQYGRRAAQRVGEPEVICEIHSDKDLANGYDLAYEAIIVSWKQNLGRWRDA